MRRQEVIDRIRKHEAELRAKGATGLLLFGSHARDEAGPDSDVDVIVEYDSNKPFGMRFFAVNLIIEDEFARRVDLTTDRALHPRLKDRILAEAVRIF